MQRRVQPAGTATAKGGGTMTGRPDGFGVTFGGVVTRVLDGDTVEVEVRRTVRVRLLDCWAPETRTKDRAEKRRGIAARKALQAMVDGEQVVVDVPIDAQGKFGDSTSMGRVLGYLWHKGQDVAAAMIAAGHAKRTKQG